MCGRYSFFKKERLVDRFSVPEEEVRTLFDHYNVAPTQTMPVIVNDGGANHVRLMRWGLIPHWAKDRSIGSRMINARAESLAEKPSFKRPLQRHRCLVPARGFFEWKQEDGRKVPYFIRLADGDFFGFAGLFDTWRDPERAAEVQSYTIVTTSPTEQVATVHDRMPVIVPRDAEQTWVDPKVTDIVELLGILQPSAERLELYPVSTRVNSPRNDSPELLERATHG